MQTTAVLALLSLGVLWPLAAHAQEQKVKIRVEVVLASNKGDTVDPPELAQMKDTFRK
jgi:hypothetical protein